MTCDHCVASVTEETTEIDGVTGVAVDLPTGAVTVTSTEPVDDAAINAAAEEAATGSRPGVTGSKDRT